MCVCVCASDAHYDFWTVLPRIEVNGHIKKKKINKCLKITSVHLLNTHVVVVAADFFLECGSNVLDVVCVRWKKKLLVNTFSCTI